MRTAEIFMPQNASLFQMSLGRLYTLAAACAVMVLLFLTSARVGNAQTSHQSLQPSESGAGARVYRAAPSPLTKRIAALRSSNMPGGSRVTITSDSSLQDYSAHAKEERFYLLIPQADATSIQGRISGRGFTGTEIEQRGSDVLLSFRLPPGVTARVNQSFNRLDVIFATPEAARESIVSSVQGPKPDPSPAPAANTANQGNAPAETTTQEQPATNANEPSAAKRSSTTTATKDSAGRNRAVLPPEKAQPVRIARFEKPPVIDGRLDDEVWQQAPVLKDFYQFRPSDTAPASRQTEALIGYDAKFLYLAFHAYEEPSKVRATVAKRDGIENDDGVAVYLDTFNDQRRAYVLIFNPLGVQQDGFFTEGRGEDYSVDIVMESKGVITDDGYTVEVAIPFKSLRYEAGKGKNWGINVLRSIPHLNNELDSWMPVSKDNSGWLNQAGRITGLEGISTERTLELIPSLTISETGQRVSATTAEQRALNSSLIDPGRFVNQPIAVDPGLTAKFGITPTVTLDLALNPDFAQVEADQTVVTANQRFPIFFEEKRPFFLEGIDIFQSPLQAVHTRAIVDPDLAVKLTGKRGRNTFGLMVASDNAPGNFIGDERLDPDNFRFLDKNAYIGVLRLKRDIGRENSLGLLATTYNFIEKHNHLGGFDGRFRLDQQSVFEFQVLGTTSRNFFRDPDLGRSIYRTGNAFAYSVRYEKDGRHFGYNFDGQGRTRDYRADVGFTRRVNTNREGLFVYYRSEPKPKAKLVSWRINNLVDTNFDWQGRMQYWGEEFQVNFNFQQQTFWGIGFSHNYERIFEEEFGNKRNANQRGAFYGEDNERSTNRRNIFSFLETTPTKKYSLFIFSIYNWDAFDFDFGAGKRFPRVSPVALRYRAAGLNLNDAPLDPGPGNSLDLRVNFAYQPTNALRASLQYTKSRLVRHDTGLVAFDDNIISLRTTYQFTRFTFARARVDYDTLAANMRGQFLFGWTPNPGTSFYVGYNDDMNRNGFSPINGQLEPGFRRNGRTFFIKMSYLFRRSIS